MLNHKKPIDAEKRKKKFINADSSLKKYASDESASTSLDASANFFFNIVANLYIRPNTHQIFNFSKGLIFKLIIFQCFPKLVSSS